MRNASDCIKVPDFRNEINKFKDRNDWQEAKSMSRSQGKYFSNDELKRIVMLLRESDMSLPAIADRMRCSRSAVAAINRKFQVRVYAGKRSQWTLADEPGSVQTEVLDSRTPPSLPDAITIES